MAEGFILNYFPNIVLWKSSGHRDSQGLSRWGRKPWDHVASTFSAENRLRGPWRRRGEKRGGPATGMPTHCSAERVRFAAKASATDLVPSSLIVLLWRLWGQGGGLNPLQCHQGPRRQQLTMERRGLTSTSASLPARCPGWGARPLLEWLWLPVSLWVSKHLPADWEEGVPGIWITAARLSIFLIPAKSHSTQMLTGM